MKHLEPSAALPLIERIEKMAKSIRDKHIADLGGLKKTNVNREGVAIGRPRFRAPEKPIDHGDASLWIEVCSRLCIAGGADAYDPCDRRGYSIACQMLKLNYADVQKLVSDYRNYGREATIDVWASSIGTPSDKNFGFLYCAHKFGAPDVVKIGFSTNVAKRLLRISRDERATMIELSVRPATLLHEWAIHNTLLGAVKSEWYPRSVVPGFLREAA